MKKITNTIKPKNTRSFLRYGYVAVLAILLSLETQSCSKYKDGPLLSIRSRSERVANNWKVGEAIDNGKDVTADYTRYELSLTKGGSAALTAKYKFGGADFDYTTSGTWKFVSDDQQISLDVDNKNASGIYDILKLQENNMWVKKIDNSVELHLIPM